MWIVEYLVIWLLASLLCGLLVAAAALGREAWHAARLRAWAFHAARERAFPYADGKAAPERESAAGARSPVEAVRRSAAARPA